MNNSTIWQIQEMSDRSFNFLVTIITINTLNGVIATVLNFMVILTFLKTPSLRTTPSNILIFNLAITDLGIGVVVEPFTCTLYAVMIKEDILLRSILVDVEIPVDILINASILTITALTVDRFLALHFHIRYDDLITTKRVWIVLIVLWTFSVLSAISLAFVENILIEQLLGMFLFFINIVLMIKISNIVNQHAAQIQVQQLSVQAQLGAGVNMKRSVNIMYCILCAFFICYFPSICVRFIEVYGQFDRNTVGIIVCAFEIILFVNSSINPVIYFWRIQDMRNAAAKLLDCILQKRFAESYGCHRQQQTEQETHQQGHHNQILQQQ